MTASMRIAVFLLLLANLFLFVWTQGYLGAPANPDARRVAQQLLPEKVKIVSRGEESRPASKKVEAENVVEKTAAESCQLWSDLTSADAEQIERLLADRFAAFKALRHAAGEVSAFWVFIPPLASKEEATRKTTELQQLGVQEFFIVPNGGVSPLAISLGSYRSEEAANARLEALRAKGVKSAKVGERKGKSSLNALEIRGPEAQAETLREAIAALLPKASPAACKAKSEAVP
ncbi:SPOR domain-containing protein [Accumulibacter sp.]|uniref:SPOR domain-containing protein n=1 Tax=Accumulibacter sp. TaxID=2053492 RepID=UPI0028C452C0|nr:SPOR domain-containing protein [Accumulibacter sp.]